LRPKDKGSSMTTSPCDEQRTAPPVRLRMTSSDILCARSMEVEWEDGTGHRQHWSSWTDDVENGWYDAEKLLPASVTDIRVYFKIHGVGGPWDVCKVDRQSGCSWVISHGRHLTEEIWARAGQHDIHDDMDCVFELRGPMNACYLCRAWNAARRGFRERWEHWGDKLSRPVPEERAATLDAADSAAPLSAFQGNPKLYCICTTKRMCSALRALTDVHRQTLKGLRELDAKFTGQWVGVNVGTTASAGLGIASAVTMFLAPPVGVGLGIGSALTGGIAFTGDSLADRAHLADFRKQLSKDAWNSFVVAELIKEWMQARQALQSISQHEASSQRAFSVQPEGAGSDSFQTVLGDAFASTLTAGAVVEGAGAFGVRVADGLGKTAAAASQVLGIAGALISTGFAVHGWSTIKSGQKVVRQKIGELIVRLLQIQHLLASVDRLECPICADNIILADSVRHCLHSAHCFHETCMSHLERRRIRSCPECAGPLCTVPEMLLDSTAKVLDEIRVQAPELLSQSAEPKLLATQVTEQLSRKSRHGRKASAGCMTTC